MTTYAEVKQIKRLLWEGHLTQTAIARRYKTSQPTVSRIAQGSWWADVPWPDRGTGGMSPERDRVTKESRRRHASFSSLQQVGQHPESRAAGYLRLSYNELIGELYRIEPMSWKRISLLDPFHPIVAAFEVEGNTDLVNATIRVFSLLPIEEWGIAPTYELIERVRKELEK